MDADLEGLSREQLVAEVKRLRHGIRDHRDSTGHELCWHHPALWSLLPEGSDPLPVVPDGRSSSVAASGIVSRSTSRPLTLLEAMNDEVNVASLRVLEKLGFERIATQLEASETCSCSASLSEGT
jgi:hypothetical protein